MQDLTITMVQADLGWEDIDANLAMLDQHLDGIHQPIDLIILPEMFSTGFSMAAEQLAEEMTGKAVTWLRQRSAAQNAIITGSVIIKEAGHYFNRMVWAQPNGQMATYDKKHLFRYAGEHKIYTAGTTMPIWELKGWRIRPFICYDLRFPIWCRNLNQTYDLALFVANWPAKRAHHWRQLLIARAIENQAYVIGVNRVGVDGNGHGYAGGSMALNPKGETLFEASEQTALHTLTLQREDLQAYRESFPAWMDADTKMVIDEEK